MEGSLQAPRRRRLVGCLEQLNGVEEIVVNSAGRVLVIFYQVLITADDIMERLVESGYPVRVVRGRKAPPPSKSPFLH